MKNGRQHSADAMTEHRVEVIEDDFRFDLFVELLANFLHLGHFFGQFGTRQFEMGRRTVR